MNNKHTQLLTALLLLAMTFLARADDAEGNAIVGRWKAIGRAFFDLTLEVTGSTITIGPADACKSIPYSIIADRDGKGTDTIPSRPGEKWHEIAIELVPTNDIQAKCYARTRVFDFSISADKRCNAELALFKSRAEFEAHSQYHALGYLNKKNCSAPQ
jgi:hypothetical protein